MIKKIFLILSIFFFFFLIVIIFSFKNFNQPTKKFYKENGFKIGTTIYPLYYFVSQISGNKNDIILILPAGSDPHNFDLNPEIFKKISQLDYLLITGLDIDFWSSRITGVKTKVMTQGLDLIKEDSYPDPHFWFSLKENKKLAKNILDFFILIDEKNKDYYEKNYKELISKLEKFDENLKIELKDIKTRKLVLEHNFLNYFARDYNFQILGVLEKENGDLTPQEIKNLIEEIKKNKIKVIFGEKFKTEGKVENFAKDLNLKVYYLDNLETGEGDFFERYQENIKIIKEALSVK
ncbi:Manganese ABC transporter substrate-binding lipoprotein [bacterium HR35]|nr:Manganese ABC transporter substrate-binding lipoprotein [bacterium HR35]